MPKNNIIEVRNLVKKYKKSKINAVDDISFEVKEGEFFALLGPNGAGKTTTISVLTTTLAKTSGIVNIAGFDLDQNPSQVRESIGVIFQNPSLDKNLTAEENIRFHAILYGLYPFRPTFGLMPKAYKNKVDELAKLLGLEKEIFKPIKTYSGGMKRKLEIVRSLIHKPKIIFLDEPTSGLDPISRKSLWEYLMKVREEEKTTLFLTTHYLEEAEKADRVSIINNGKIVKIGTPSKIKQDLTREILIVDSKKRNALRDELLKNKIKFVENKHFDIDLKNKNA
ncbi:MAG: ABC transporter ATP-binding protein, partial [Candidatus Levybacteria bacterium CG10_big_fil_rev_8_21_14_0_10_36_7]